MTSEEPNRSAASIVQFCRFAREHGLPAGIQQTLAAIEVAKTVQVRDRREFAFALRTVLSSSKEEWDLFNQLFEAFWTSSQDRSEPVSRVDKEARSSSLRPKASSRALMTQSSSEDSSPDHEGKAVSG